MNQDDNGITKLGCVNHDCDKCKARQQEPVAVYVGETWCGSVVRLYEELPLETPLYTSPPASKPWVGLTPEDKLEIEKIVGITEDDDGWMVSQMFTLTENKLRKKNA